jgi:sulfur relay (sulfurtransferase) DsrC/TusE family protein
MTERQIIADNIRLNYTGIFDPKGIMQVIKDWAFDKGYVVAETSHTESLTDEGKFAEIKLEPFKKLTDYSKSVIKIIITIENSKDTVIEKDKKKIKLYDGTIRFLFDALLDTDYEARWEGKPIFYFIRTVFEKYIYSPFISNAEKQIKADLEYLKTNIKSYLNLYKF